MALWHITPCYCWELCPIHCVSCWKIQLLSPCNCDTELVSCAAVSVSGGLGVGKGSWWGGQAPSLLYMQVPDGVGGMRRGGGAEHTRGASQ